MKNLFLILLAAPLLALSQTDSTYTLDFAVYNAKTGVPITDFELDINYTDGTSSTFYVSDFNELDLCLKPSEKYSITIGSEGFLGMYDLIDLSSQKTSSFTIQKEYFLDPICHYHCCYLSPPIIRFNFNSHQIIDSLSSDLTHVKTIMLENPDLIIQVKGFSSEGEYDILALQRATVIQNWLIKNGVNPECLTLDYSNKNNEPSMRWVTFSALGYLSEKED